jgi:flagellar basal-body rod protein FlgF
MNTCLYLAMSGAKQTLLAQNSNANNLANMQTTGFKSDLQWLNSRPVYGAGHPAGVYAMIEKPGADFSHGTMQTTGRDLDVAINGDGLIAVQGDDGKEAYTRAGNLVISPQGLLRTETGLQIIGQNGPITIPPAEKMTIGSDGTISIVPMGAGNATTLEVLDRIKLVKPAMSAMEKRGDGLLHPKNGMPVAASTDVSLNQGVLEGSNVNGLSAMVNMIELARNFELQTKMMKSVDENSAASAKLMQMA